MSQSSPSGDITSGRCVKIGLVCQPSRSASAELLWTDVKSAADLVGRYLKEQFGTLEWNIETNRRRPIPVSHLGVDPIDLMETGCGEKIACGWDFAFVVTDAELIARERPFTIGIPSSALETGVMTTARFPESEAAPEVRLAVMAQYLLGHLLGLEPHEPGAMRRPSSSSELRLEEFDEKDRGQVMSRLVEVADQRLEVRRPTLNRIQFSLSAFMQDPKGILTDVVGYQPWLQPFRLGRLTAAAFITTLLLFLGAEAWELGAGMNTFVSVGAALLSVGCGAAFLYRGQNLTKLTRRQVLSEQLARSHVVLLICLSTGMATLWLLLFLASAFITCLLPWPVIGSWIEGGINLGAAVKFSMFTATLGTLAGALGGNLEDEDDFKAQFLFDEEA